MDITQVNKDCEFLAVHVDTTMFASSRQHRDFMKQIKSLAESTRKKVVVLDNGIKLEQLTDDDLRAAGLVRADFSGLAFASGGYIKGDPEGVPAGIQHHSSINGQLTELLKEDGNDKASNS